MLQCFDHCFLFSSVLFVSVQLLLSPGQQQQHCPSVLKKSVLLHLHLLLLAVTLLSFLLVPVAAAAVQTNVQVCLSVHTVRLSHHHHHRLPLLSLESCLQVVFLTLPPQLLLLLFLPLLCFSLRCLLSALRLLL